MAESQANDNNTCVVCFKNVVYYSIGECDHPVCSECSTRMRVLCLQNECPICRQHLSRVVFTESIQPYKELRNRVFTDRLFERQFKIGFCSEEIKNSYESLLENHCKICDNLPPFRTFSMLNDHVRKVHEKYFCDLCVKHLRIFTAERKCYTRQDLAHHRRKGDIDDTSHRGHPLCEFCEERFMDNDELYRHLRKEHLYCHLCDADGRNLYYASHSALAHHFRTDHYLCEEGDCDGNHLTAVFRSEIDLIAHKATVHGRGLNRGAARQARTLELQFNITPHPVQSRPRDRDRRDGRDGRDGRDSRDSRDARDGRDGGYGRESPSPPPPPASIDTRSDAQFPRLSAAPPAPASLLNSAAHNRAYKGGDSLARTNKNFPTLGGGAAPRPAPAPAPSHNKPVAATILRNSKPSLSIQLHSQPASASNFRLTQTSGNRISIPQQPQRKTPLSEDDFPSLGIGRDDHPSIGAGTTQAPKVALINSQEMQAMKTNHSAPQQPKKPQLNLEAFPALSASAAPAASPQWITLPKPKEKPKPNKPDPPPQPKTFDAAADFPTLHTKKNKKTVQPQPQPRPQPQPQQPRPQPQARPQPPPSNVQADVKLSKKEKKRQNLKRTEEDTDTDFTYVNGLTDKFSKQQIREAYNAAVNNNNTLSAENDRKIKTVETTSAASAEKSNGGNGDFALAPREYPPLGGGGAAGGGATAPPGFRGMTFTNSSGQTFPAVPHEYISPPGFERRNRELVRQLSAALGSAAAVDRFKAASRAFRSGGMAAEDFHAHVAAAAPQALPELVALLPDIGKQQELAAAAGLTLAACEACGQLLAPKDEPAHRDAHWPPLHA